MKGSYTVPSDPPSGTAIQPGSVPPVVIGQSVDLVCTATGDPPISFTWVLMGEETNRLNSDSTSGNFTLTITQVNQYGVYICITTNNLGTDAASVDIIQASKSTIQSNVIHTQLDYYAQDCYCIPTMQSYVNNCMMFLTFL